MTKCVVPCPTDVFTLGWLLWAGDRVPWYVRLVPVIGALSGPVPISAGIVEDVILLAAGLIWLWLWLRRRPADAARTST